MIATAAIAIVSTSAYRLDRCQLRIPNVPKSDGHARVTRQFVQLLETAPGKELRRPRKRNDPVMPARFPRNLIRRAYRRRQER